LIFTPCFVQIGFVEKTHGTKGGLRINFNKNSISSEMEFLFLEQCGQKVPYQIEQFNLIAGIVKLIGCDTPEVAQKFVKSGIYHISDEAHTPEQHKWIGFTLQNQEKVPIGKVIGIEEIPGNPLWMIVADSGMFYIPFNQELILKIDENNNLITYQILEGLLDL